MDSMQEDAAGVAAAFRAAAARNRDKTAIYFKDRSVSYHALDAQSDALAAGLRRHGIEAGQRVALYAPNSDQFVIAYLGIVKAGAVVVPINLLLNPKEIAYILNDAGASALIYHASLAAAVQALDAAEARLQFRVCIEAPAAAPGDLSWDELQTADVAPPQCGVDWTADLVSILYTSGTTGRPKGAMLTHRNLLSNCRSVVRAMDIQDDDRLLVVLPMFHAFAATVGMLTPLVHGCALVPCTRFEPVAIADTIAARQATIFLGVPSMYGVFMNLADEHVAKFASLRYCISGAAALPQELMKRFEARFGVTIYEGDGPTECSPVTCVNPINGRRKLGSVGLPIPGVDMRILDQDGNQVAVDEVGEICVRGPNVMKGYWRREADTAEAFFGDWFRTGDLGYCDADGYFYIVDRIKDLIIVNGMNVYPRVIEEVLYQHPAVAEAAVVGEPNERHGEIAVACIVLKEGADADQAAIRQFCQQHLGRHEVPRKVVFLEALPKNAAGKILKRELRKHGELERGVDSRD